MKAVLKKVLGLSLLAIASIAAAQSKFPDGSIKMIVPFAPGGGVDSAARLIAKQMQSNLNVIILVEYHRIKMMKMILKTTNIEKGCFTLPEKVLPHSAALPLHRSVGKATKTRPPRRSSKKKSKKK